MSLTSKLHSLYKDFIVFHFYHALYFKLFNHYLFNQIMESNYDLKFYLTSFTLHHKKNAVQITKKTQFNPPCLRNLMVNRIFKIIMTYFFLF